MVHIWKQRLQELPSRNLCMTPRSAPPAADPAQGEGVHRQEPFTEEIEGSEKASVSLAQEILYLSKHLKNKLY